MCKSILLFVPEIAYALPPTLAKDHTIKQWDHAVNVIVTVSIYHYRPGTESVPKIWGDPRYSDDNVSKLRHNCDPSELIPKTRNIFATVASHYVRDF